MEKLTIPSEPIRVRLPDERNSLTHKFVLKKAYKKVVEKKGKQVEVVLDVEGYITAGVYPNGRLGEVFLTIGKQGGTWKAYDCLMTAVSVGLQCGIPLFVFKEKFENQQFEPAGVTNNPEIPLAKSIPDYVFRWLELRFPNGINESMARKDAKDVDSGCNKVNSDREKETSGAPSI
jgi:ribonucleoside-diphosphate reductase alpha chain